MSREAGQFGEGFSAQVTRAEQAPAVLPEAPPTTASTGLTAEQLGDLLCVVPWVRAKDGEEGTVVVTCQDWQRWMDQHGLIIARRTP